MQPQTNHFVWTKEETVIQTHGTGPGASPTSTRPTTHGRNNCPCFTPRADERRTGECSRAALAGRRTAPHHWGVHWSTRCWVWHALLSPCVESVVPRVTGSPGASPVPPESNPTWAGALRWPRGGEPVPLWCQQGPSGALRACWGGGRDSPGGGGGGWRRSDQSGGGSQSCAEQGPAADCLQRPLLPRSRFRQRLKPGVIAPR